MLWLLNCVNLLFKFSAQGDCNMEGDEITSKINPGIHNARYTAEMCKKKCTTTGQCIYYVYDIDSRSCKLYNRPEKRCRGKLGSSDAVLRTCSKLLFNRQWESENQTCSVFRWSKVRWLINSPKFKKHLKNGHFCQILEWF